MVYEYIDFVKANGYFERRRAEQNKYWMYESINEALHSHFYNNPEIAALLHEHEKAIQEGAETSFTAASDLLNRYFGKQK